MKKGKARKVLVGPQRRPVYIFSDGSCDPDERSKFGIKAGYGTVLYDPETDSGEAFGSYLDEKLIEILSDGGTKRQIVGQSELVPCVAAKVLWKKKLRGRLVMHYVDNEAAKYGLIKGSSPTRGSAWLINEFRRWVADQESFTWFERVPSASNCAGDPSRGKGRDTVVNGRKVAWRRMLDSIEKNLAESWAVQAADELGVVR